VDYTRVKLNLARVSLQDTHGVPTRSFSVGKNGYEIARLPVHQERGGLLAKFEVEYRPAYNAIQSRRAVQRSDMGNG
jgi:hypothetical protein